MYSAGKKLHFKLSALEKTQPFAFSYELGPPYDTHVYDDDDDEDVDRWQQHCKLR